MRTIFAEYNQQCNSIDVYTSAGYMLRIDCWEAEKNLKTTPGSDCTLNALAIDDPLEYARLCGVLVILFVIIGVLFAIFKEKAAKFVSGFNSLPKEEQALYDKAHISRDIKNQCFTWAGIMLVGAVLSYFLTPYMAIPAFIIWLVLLFKAFHLLYDYTFQIPFCIISTPESEI